MVNHSYGLRLALVVALLSFSISRTTVVAQLEEADEHARQGKKSQFDDVAWPDDVPERMKPFMLLANERMPQLYEEANYSFHWVITTCTTRVKWGRMLTTTLLSGLLNGLQPASISIVYCRPYDPDTIPALLYNLRNSRYVNLFFPPNITEPMKHPRYEPYWLATETVLLVPTMLGAPEVPLLMTEDDIIFAPDAHIRINQALTKVLKETTGEPFYLNLYLHETNMKLAHNQTSVKQAVTGEKKAIKLIRRNLTGFQGAVFSEKMVRIFRKKFTELLKGVGTDDPDYIGWSDKVVQKYIIELGCNRHGSGCHAFVVEPSIVQHAGTSSTTHPGKGNTSFHVAKSFPVHVAFAGFENDTLWRKA